MRLHLIGFPHTKMTDAYSTCAFTQKVAKFALMGWDELTVYATEGSEVPEQVELVELLTDEERVELAGGADADDRDRPPRWPTEDEWRVFNLRAAAEVAKRADPSQDLLLLAGGWDQRTVAELNPALIHCEPGVGYTGIWSDRCAFESYAWMHHVYGLRGIHDGRWFDAVIPNYFDPDDFPDEPLPMADRDDYLLFVGRVVRRKGVTVAFDIAQALGLQLVVAGPGVAAWEDGAFLISDDGIRLEGNVRYVGVLPPLERAQWMGAARALVCPTSYVEPFGGVAVEAMLCGTPVIATDWGAFAETIEDAVTGARIRTLQDGVDAVRFCPDLDPPLIQEWAFERYSLVAVRARFERWFEQLSTLRHGGWYELRRHEAV